MSRVHHDNLVKVNAIAAIIFHVAMFYWILHLWFPLIEDNDLTNLIFVSFYYSFLQFIGACKDPLMVIVTELLPGMSLRKYLTSIRPKPLDIHVAINFALDIARAMDWLHDNGIIHRDLKPGIIMY